MSDHDDNGFLAEVLPAFVSEAQEQIATIEQLLLQLEDAPGDRELLDALFRCAHTVKGSAGIFGLDAVVAFTHHVETLLDHLRNGELVLTPSISTLLLQCNDQIRRLIEQTSTGHREDDADCARREALVVRITALLPLASAASPGAAPAEPRPSGPSRSWSLSARFGTDTFRHGNDPLALLTYLGQLGTLSAVQCDDHAVPALDALDPEACHLGFSFELHTDRGCRAIEEAFSFAADDTTLQIRETGTPTPPAEPEAAPAAGGEPAAAKGVTTDPTRYIRVQADRLDAVINLLGELVIASAGASLLARQTRNSALIEVNQQIGTLVEDIRNATLQLRMVPIGETFSRFRRVVRDTAAELGKDVALEIVGGETELDKSMVERIADPLMHLVRNALDHGLEPPAERSAAGKPPRGTLTLSAHHESGSVVIRISDDGRGIRRQKVLQRAWDRGLVEPGKVPGDEQICDLIFAPGFSTADTVTNLSGRGVGMDVVRSNIEALRGHVAIDSTEGRGSTIEIRLPLTLAIIDGFLVGVGASKFVFPLESVVEVVEDRPSTTPMDERGRAVIELRGRVLPLLSLRRLYALEGPVPPRCSVVVIRCGHQRFGVQVDALLGQHQTVIKPLSRLFRSLRGMAGSSILGNGEVALIVEVASLSQLASEPTSQHESILS